MKNRSTVKYAEVKCMSEVRGIAPDLYALYLLNEDLAGCFLPASQLPGRLVPQKTFSNQTLSYYGQEKDPAYTRPLSAPIATNSRTSKLRRVA